MKLPDYVKQLTEPIVVYDVGCRGGFDPSFVRLGSKVHLYGFDADPDECVLVRQKCPQGVVYDVALGDCEKWADLYVTDDPACSSLAPPSSVMLRYRPDTNKAHVKKDVRRVKVETLDGIAAKMRLLRPDYIKVDTQGFDLDVIDGGTDSVRRARVCKVEVMFNPMYEGQRLFGDLDRTMRARGFVLWRLTDLNHYRGHGDRNGPGQLHWANAHYVARSMAYPQYTDEPTPRDRRRLLRDRVIAECAGLMDLAAHVEWAMFQ